MPNYHEMDTTPRELVGSVQQSAEPSPLHLSAYGDGQPHQISAREEREATQKVRSGSDKIANAGSKAESDMATMLELEIVAGDMKDFKISISDLGKDDGKLSTSRIFEDANAGFANAGSNVRLDVTDKGNVLLSHLSEDAQQGEAMEFSTNPGEASFPKYYQIMADGDGSLKMSELRGGELSDNKFLGISNSLIRDVDNLPSNADRPKLVDHSGDGYLR